MYKNCHLIIFTRFPEAGKTKTRLIPALGPEKAAKLQQRMTEKISREALMLIKESAISVTIFYTGSNRKKMSAWLGNSFDYQHQCTGHIGIRMSDAFARILCNQHQSIILAGSDIPGLTAKIIREGFKSLNNADAIIGPSSDGGYYLVGMKAKDSPKLSKILFSRIPWSTNYVLQTSLQHLIDSGHSYSLLQTLSDIDRPEDLHLAGGLDFL